MRGWAGPAPLLHFFTGQGFSTIPYALDRPMNSLNKVSNPAYAKVCCCRRHSGVAGAGAKDLDVQELRFLGDFWELMRAGHYRALGRGEWESALAEDFMVSFSAVGGQHPF